jgi:hypothetical protein
MHLAVNQALYWHGGSNPSTPTKCGRSSTVELLPSKQDVARSIRAARSIPSRNSQAVEGGRLQICWRKPSLVQIQLPSPFPDSSAGRGVRLLPGRSAVARAEPSAYGSSQATSCAATPRRAKPCRGAKATSRSSVAEHRLDKAGAGGSLPPARTTNNTTRCGAAGSARVSGTRGRPFDPDHRDQSCDVRSGVAVAQWQSRGL